MMTPRKHIAVTSVTLQTERDLTEARLLQRIIILVIPACSKQRCLRSLGSFSQLTFDGT